MTHKFKRGDKVRIASPEEFGRVFAECGGVIAGNYTPDMLKSLGKEGVVSRIACTELPGYALDTDHWTWDERLLFLVEPAAKKNVIPKGESKKGVIYGATQDFIATLKYVGPRTYATIKFNNKRYTGRATCSPEDTWNREKGTRIAVLRAIAAWRDSELNELCK